MPLTKRLSAEFLGTLWLVLGGCGTAVIAGSLAGNVGISLAFGLTVLTAAYAIGHISGCHLNPAVTLGLWAGKRFEAKEIPPYIIAQVLGAIAGAGLLYVIANDKVGFILGGFAANGYGEHSPGKYGALAGFVCEVAMTFFFLIVILGATHKLAPKGFAPIAIGLCLTLIHLVSIQVTNTSINPARSTGPAVFVQGWALTQLWMFWVAPILGALLAGFVYTWLVGDDAAAPLSAETPAAVPETTTGDATADEKPAKAKKGK
jgi:aquaporin Z